MKKIAPDIDRLMWTIAEESDLQAAEEFEKRFPELKLELAKRFALVRNLKVSRAPQANSGEIPRFTPRPAPATYPLLRPAWAAGLALLLVLVAFGSYQLTAGYMRNRPPEVVPIPAAPRAEGQPAPDTVNPRDVLRGNAPQVRQDRQYDPPPAPVTPTYMRPTTVALEDVGLHTALIAIADQTGMSLDIAPGTPNPSITISYTGVSGFAMIEDMGKQYGFTALHQGENRFLIIPAREESRYRQELDDELRPVRP
jgi:hypothetical protein